MTEGHKLDEPSTRTVKHSLLWRPEEWARLEQAARLLEEQTHAEVEIPNFIRGAVMRRVDEILGPVEQAAT